MADKKISELTEKTSLHTDDEFALVDKEAEPDETKKVTVETMTNYFVLQGLAMAIAL